MAICAWVILITLFRNPGTGRLARLFAVLAPTTLGLYLIHPMFREILYSPYTLRDFLASNLHLGFLWKWESIDPISPNAMIGIPLMAAIIYLLSLGAVLLMMRIPIVRKVVE